MSEGVLCLRTLPIFAGLPPDEFRNVCLNAVKKTLKKGEYLFYQDQPADTIYLIKDGTVKLVQCTEEGKEVILDLVGRGRVLGETALFKQQTHLSDAIALETVHVCAFSLRNFEALIAKNPNIALSIIANLGDKLYATLRQLGETANNSVENRLLGLMFRLAKEHGEPVALGQLIKLNLTQQDMANMIGASRVMVAQVMKRFKAQGLIAKSGKYYVLTDQCLNKHFS